MENSSRPESVPDWAPRGPSQKPLFRLIAAFGLSIPLVAVSLLEAGARPQVALLWSGGSWLACGLLAGWNAVEYGLGRAPHGGQTPAWLRWALAVPYFAVTWVGVRTVAAMVAGLAYLAAAGS
ncbi:MAG: hypothetical protein HZB56_05995 [Deltaproteobacteria bacterium]|nr:hypothetical protein [Deltaproteobacteria bacterium]